MARTSIESGTSSSKSSANPKGGGKAGNLDQGQKIKLAVSIGVILLVIVFLLYQFGFIFAGGNVSQPSDVPAEQVQELNEQIERAKNAPPPPANAPTQTGSQ